MPSSFCLPPVECSRGTTPIQAANSRPLWKAPPLPMAAMTAVAVTGPMPGMATSQGRLLATVQKLVIAPSWPSLIGVGKHVNGDLDCCRTVLVKAADPINGADIRHPEQTSPRGSNTSLFNRL